VLVLLNFISVGTLKGDVDVANLTQTGTLRDIHRASQDDKNPFILNGLENPLGHATMPAPPLFKYASILWFLLCDLANFSDSLLASNERAWCETRGQFPFDQDSPPLADELSWGTAATQHATSWMHEDDDGFGTVVAVKTGAKYWVVARPRNKSANPSHIKFSVEWDPMTPNVEDYEMEAVHLRPGHVL
jgi:hypothetical protein